MRIVATVLMGSMLALSPGLASAGDVQSGRMKASVCQGCHGRNGTAISPMFPNLAGQQELYLRKAMRDYKSGARRDPQCSPVAKTLSNADIDNLAAYFANQK